LSRPPPWLLLRRHGVLWALPHAALGELSARRPATTLELRGGATLEADEVLGLAAEIEPRPFPRCARRFYRDTVAGLAVWRRQPVVLVDPGSAPPSLAVEKENPVHGDEIR
jgi:hypothetical protein